MNLVRVVPTARRARRAKRARYTGKPAIGPGRNHVRAAWLIQWHGSGPLPCAPGVSCGTASHVIPDIVDDNYPL